MTTPSPTSLDTRPTTIAIFAATTPELLPAARRLNLKRVGRFYVGENGSIRVVGVVTGMGPTNAAAALVRLLDTERVGSIISIGFAGGLQPSMHPGDLLEIWWITNTDGGIIRITERVPEVLADAPDRTPQRTLLTMDRLVDSVANKHRLHLRHNASAVDMESYQLAKVAAQLKVSFRAIRAISDPSNMSLPAAAVNWVTPSGHPATWAVLRDLIKHPSWLSLLLMLRKHANMAGEVVAKRTQEIVRVEAEALLQKPE